MNLNYKNLSAFVDPDAFNKILYNLFSNAIKYAEKEVFITLLPVADNTFQIEFINDGFLIPFDMKEAIESFKLERYISTTIKL